MTSDDTLGALGVPGSAQREDVPDRRQRSDSGKQIQQFVLTLYVASLTPRSVTAIQSIKAICERYLQGRYWLEVIDIYEQPSLAKGAQIVAAPTLIKQLPLPLRRLIGDMADQDRVLARLDLRATADITPIAPK